MYREQRGTRTGLDENAAGALAYLLAFITGIVFYVVEQENTFVRFHAAQSIIVFGSLFIISMVLGLVSTLVFPIPGVGELLAAVLATTSLLIGPVSVVLWLVLIYKAYTGEQYHVPLAGAYADRYV